MLEQKVLEAIRRYRLIERGDNVIAALSGGADSVALFHFLAVHREMLGVTLYACHLEHGLRGEQSLRDAEYVAELCEAHGVPLFCEHANMAHSPRPQGLGVEAWGRRLRYDLFRRLSEQCSAKVATAHTRSDNAETVLFNAIRGTGPRGLAGIPPMRGAVVRPLLLCSRADTEAYCTAHRLRWITDSTNADATYSRNRLRLEVMPELERAHPGAEAALARMAEDMRILDDWLTTEAQSCLRRAAGVPSNRWVPPGGYDTGVLLGVPLPVRLKALGLLAAGPDMDRSGLERALEVLRGERRTTQLPGGRYAALCRGRFYLEKQPVTPVANAEIPLSQAGPVLWNGYELDAAVVEYGDSAHKSKKSAQKGLTFVADYDKINKYGVFRPRREGDTVPLPGGEGAKTLKKWMNEMGIPPQRRGSLPLLADESRVLWVWGYGFSAGLQPDENTRRLLVLRQIEAGSK